MSRVAEEEDWDFDFPITEEGLEVIDEAVNSLSSSSSPIKKKRRLPSSFQASFSSCSSSIPSHNPQSSVMFKRTHPVMNFGGRIIYSRSNAETQKVAAELLKFVEQKKRETGHVTLGLDIEWKPTFRKGVPPGKAAVLQICADNSHCYVIHIIHSGIPQNLRFLLEDATTIKVGVGIANDSRKLFKDHNVSVKDLDDLSNLANQKLGGEPRSWGLQSLTETLLCKQLEKPNRIRLGNWEARVLSKDQVRYAAIDAYASWCLYKVLKSLPDAADNEAAQVVAVP
ncbi:3'-5' exonuclease domain [Dillenia turbinata]|uniref:3'-5' exonuclease n=1 Tax=Dillenia turbinata TaxID=194707 RepID=A0AAN8YYM2_9MAGN